MEYPTMEEVERADREQLAKWVRFLPSPDDEPKRAILNEVLRRFQLAGGWSSDISKKVGWD